MELNSLIATYADRKGLKEIQLSQEGLIRLIYKEGLVLTFEQSQEGSNFYLYSGLGKILPEDEKAIFHAALYGNLFGGQTGRASLGVVPKINVLILFEFFEVEAWSDDHFEKEMDRFCHYLLFWMDKIEKIKSESKQDLSMQAHLKGLQDTGKMRIFFA